MIILDSSILRSISPKSSSADLLHAIKAVCGQRIAMPWMVQEELAAQQAIKYRELHERAIQAVKTLQQATPWHMDVQVDECDTERIRKHARERWRHLIGTIPTSDEAIRQGFFREANRLPPCKESKGQKTGARDAAIWLSAVEYAEQNLDETVFFVSANIKDFGDGTSYPYPMNEDIEAAGVADRFVLMTSLDDVASHFTQPAEADGDLVLEILTSKSVLDHVASTANMVFPASSNPSFQCTLLLPGGETVIDQATEWGTLEADLGSFEDVKAYRIGEREWCTASVEWHVTGSIVSTWFGAAWAAVTWQTAVLFTLDAESPSLTLLREVPPVPAGDEVVTALGLPPLDATPAERAVSALRRLGDASARQRWGGIPRGLPRAYEGALVRRARGMTMGETSAG